jgi:hypothetical protein
MRNMNVLHTDHLTTFILFTDQNILDRMEPDHSPQEQECKISNQLFTQCSNTFLPGVVSGVARMNTAKHLCLHFSWQIACHVNDLPSKFCVVI